MKTEDLLKIVEDGENQEIEFKSRYTDSIGKSICSFASTNDGLIIVGVSDNHKLRPEERIEGVPKKGRYVLTENGQI
jgi:predicted HTH transcriptional regulator